MSPLSKRDRFAVVAVMGLCITALGCGPREPTGTVRGKVAYKGKPVEAGSVVFFPDEGPISSGNLAQDGSFQILNFEKEEGLRLGKYTIAVIAGTDQINLRIDDPTFRVEPTIPLKFTSSGSSPLRYDIQEGPNEIAISLDDPPSVKKTNSTTQNQDG
jgi:hypothetical protein